MLPKPLHNINKTQTGKRVLLAPLDWGLGHATRCVPIITELLVAGFEVLLAADGKPAAFLTDRFPELKLLPLPGYHVKYPRSSRAFFWKMLRQIPRVKKAIRNEHDWLQTVIEKHGVDIVISDNRFGLYSDHATCIFITHQLRIKTGQAWTDRLAQSINYRYIKKFDECWVPDLPGPDNLAGDLSHPLRMPAIPVRYIGPCSRFSFSDSITHNDLLALVSGPEPQRSFFEDELLKRLKNFRGCGILLRGLPGNINGEKSEHGVLVKNHLPDSELNQAICGAAVIVARSGYSTIMDLVACRKSAVLIPTRGQTEQEYLAKYLSEKKLFSIKTLETLDLYSPPATVSCESFEKFCDQDLLRAAVNSL